MCKCFICQAVHKTCQSLVSHLRMDHSFYPSSRFKLVCAQDRCRRQFLSYSGLKKHLNSVHERDLCQSGDAANSQSCLPICHSLQGTSHVAQTNVTHGLNAGCFEDNGSNLYKEHTKNICASIVAKLQGSKSFCFNNC